jgi:aminoglycoside N3'-acetyltransferase
MPGVRWLYTVEITYMVTGEDIKAGLRQLGLKGGDAVEVHSSLRSFGTVEGGAAAVVDALMDVVGVEGALVMSAYPLSAPVALTGEEKARGIKWKLRLLGEDSRAKSAMGAISDEFRRRDGVICGTGLHRVCAWGRDARLHSKGYQHLVEIGGWVLLLGVGFDRCSSMHLAEKAAVIPEQIRARFEVPADVRRDYPADVWEIGYGETPVDPWDTVWGIAERGGLIREGSVGQARCLMFKAKAVISIYEELLRADPFALFGIEAES